MFSINRCELVIKFTVRIKNYITVKNQKYVVGSSYKKYQMMNLKFQINLSRLIDLKIILKNF